jgi:branched-chain amino acid transport system substrate-binding protein
MTEEDDKKMNSVRFARRRPATMLLIGVAVVALVSSACSSSKATKSSSSPAAAGSGSSGTPKLTGTLTVPWIIELSGAQAEFGTNEKIAIDLATKAVNDAGGIDGMKLAFDFKDYASSAPTAAQLDNQVVSNALVIMGPEGSSAAAAGLAVSNSRGVPAISASISDASVLAKNRPWSFTTFPDSSGLAKEAADKYLAANPSVKSIVAVIQQDDNAAVTQANQMVAELQAKGVKVSKTISTTGKQVDFSAVAQVVKSENPDGVLLSQDPPSGGAVMKAIRGAGVSAPALYSVPTVTTDSLKAGGTAMDNGWVEQTYYPGIGGDKAAKFLSDFQAASNGAQPLPPAATGYDAVFVLVAALKSSGVLTSKASLDDRRAALRDAIGKTSIDGLSGTLQMNPNGLVTSGGIFMQVKNGALVAAS